MAKPLSPYQRIVRAAQVGRGVRLTADETFRMSTDEAVAQVARNDDEEEASAQPEEPPTMTRRLDRYIAERVKWSPQATEHEKTLVLANLRTFANWLEDEIHG